MGVMKHSAAGGDDKIHVLRATGIELKTALNQKRGNKGGSGSIAICVNYSMHVHMQNNSLLEIHLQIGGYMLNVLELLPLRGWEREWEIREKKAISK